MIKQLSTRAKVIILGILTLGIVSVLSDDWPPDGCVDVMLGSVPLRVPRQHMTPTTPRNDNSGNYIFAFDSSVPGVECAMGCKDLFVNISSTHTKPEQSWIFLEAKFTGRLSGNYRIYRDRFAYGPTPHYEILVPSDAVRPQDEFYICAVEGRSASPSCLTVVVVTGGLTAQFWIPRKVLVRARDATHFVTQSINQFSENHIKGICK